MTTHDNDGTTLDRECPSWLEEQSERFLRLVTTTRPHELERLVGPEAAAHADLGSLLCAMEDLIERAAQSPVSHQALALFEQACVAADEALAFWSQALTCEKSALEFVGKALDYLPDDDAGDDEYGAASGRDYATAHDGEDGHAA